MNDAMEDVGELIELVSEKPSASPLQVQSGPLPYPPFTLPHLVSIDSKVTKMNSMKTTCQGWTSFSVKQKEYRHAHY
jgi:hypothetical protein